MASILPFALLTGKELQLGLTVNLSIRFTWLVVAAVLTSTFSYWELMRMIIAWKFLPQVGPVSMLRNADLKSYVNYTIRHLTSAYIYLDEYETLQ